MSSVITGRVFELITKLSTIVGVVALVDYALILLARGPIVFVVFSFSFLLKPMVTFFLVLLAAKVVFLSVVDLCKYDWGIRVGLVPAERMAFVKDVGVLVLLAVALALYYRYGTRQ
jgi:hypothetical protein